MAKLGAHVLQGPRNGYGPFVEAKPAVCLLVDIDPAETIAKSSGHTIIIFRADSVYGEAPPGYSNHPDPAALARQWYPALKQKWLLNRADYYQCTNEQGGGEGAEVEANLNHLIAFERELMKLANADGFKVCVLNLAGGSPGSIDLWRRICLPFIGEAWRAGNIYGRHAYGSGDLVHSDGSVVIGNPSRPFEELGFLRQAGASGGIAITEGGVDGGFGFAGVERFVQQLTGYEKLLRNYPEFIGVCSWTLGNWSEANWQDAIPQVTDYLKANPTPKWTPPSVPPPNPDPPPTTQNQRFWDASVAEQIARGIPLNPNAGLQRAIFDAGLTPVHREISSEGAVLQAGEDVAGVKPRRVYVYRPGQPITSFTDPGSQPVDPPTTFRFTHWPTNDKRITQAFGARPEYYAQFGLPGHEGCDIAAAHDSPIYAVAAGKVVAVGDDRKKKSEGGHNYGVRVYIDHDGGYQTVYAHLNTRLVNVGDVVQGGRQIGRADNTGNSQGTHLHLTLKKAGATAAGQTNYPLDIIDPTPFLAPLMTTPPPSQQLIDLRRFKIADPDCWRVVRLNDGRQEDVQDMQLGSGLFVRRKGNNGEWHKQDGSLFYLVHDTSPDVGSEGIPRVYTLYKNGVPGAPKSKVWQAVGEQWNEVGTHLVQFRAKDNCRLLSENSGNASNSSKIIRYERNYTFNGHGQNLTLDEVLWEQTSGETQIYARHQGKAVGWCGWKADWGSSEPVEIYWDRGKLTSEPNRYCNW